MTVSGSTIALVSNYTVGDSGNDITTSAFTSYSAMTEPEMLARVPSTLDTDMYDMLHAYLILDIFEDKGGQSDKTSETLADYSYTRSSDLAGQTVWRVRFERILKTLFDEQPSVAVTRIDQTGSRFMLDADGIGGMSDE
jgi:hypothetical protein